MITNVSLANVYVSDQDAARDFYVDTLGFELRSDVTMGDGFRWLTVGVPGQDDLEVVLALPGPPQSPEDAETVANLVAKGVISGVGLHVDDCRKTFDELSGKGVTFLQEPSDRPYGVEAVLRDNSGNWLVLVEPKQYAPGASD
jgi:catechol 2,3-dioxygenase-like lactoylglutathione lyase family enzyme